MRMGEKRKGYKPFPTYGGERERRRGYKPFPTYGGERGEGRVVNPSYLGWGKEGKILSYLWVTGLRVSNPTPNATKLTPKN